MLSCHVVTNDTRKPKVAIVSEEPVAPIPIGPSNSLLLPFLFFFFSISMPISFLYFLTWANATLILRSIAY